MKKIYIFCLAILLVLSFIGCTNNKSNIELKDQAISHETKFGGIYINITIADFNKLGFTFGDSVYIKFSNGYELLDLPYYTGYYVDIDESLFFEYLKLFRK